MIGSVGVAKEPHRKDFVSRVAGLACALGGAAACGGGKTALQAPAHVPSFQIDRAASEVHVVGTTDAETIRKVAGDALDAMVAARVGARVPARYVALVKASDGFNFACVFAIVPGAVLAGMPTLLCPYTRYWAEVDLTIETVDGKSVKGQGEASKSAFDGNFKPSPAAWEEAVHNAFQDALAHATSTGGTVARGGVK